MTLLLPPGLPIAIGNKNVKYTTTTYRTNKLSSHQRGYCLFKFILIANLSSLGMSRWYGLMQMTMVWMAAQVYMIHSLKGEYPGKVQFSLLPPDELCGKLPHISLNVNLSIVSYRGLNCKHMILYLWWYSQTSRSFPVHRFDGVLVALSCTLSVYDCS